MDAEDDLAGESGYEASNEAVMTSSSVVSGSDYAITNTSPDTFRVLHRQSTERPSAQRQATTPPSPMGDRYPSSPIAPSIDRVHNERLRFHSQVPSTTITNDSERSSFPSSPDSQNQPSIHFSKEMNTGKTAREVAERAQDEMLINAGLQQSPAQLIKKTSRPPVNLENVPLYVRTFTGVCKGCRRKKVHRIRCLHKVTEYKTEGKRSGPAARHWRLSNLDDGHKDVSARQHGGSSFKAASTETVPPRKRGKPSQWQKRREQENERLAQQERTEIEPIEVTGAFDEVPKRKKGRPVGWRKGMDISYADFVDLHGQPEP